MPTFRAGRFEEAMAEVKRVLGADALIVSRRDLTPSELPAGERSYVEITAIAGTEAGKARTPRPRIGPLPTLERRLLQGGVPKTAVQVIVDQLRERQQEPLLGMSALEEVLVEVLRQEIAFGDERKARVVALVGPTGVGKTTTIAKIAAHEQLELGRNVGLVTLDQYRIGGAEQLARYAELIGCPMLVASDARSLEVALRRLSDAQLVLVDTAGRSPRDACALQEMASHLYGVQEPVEVQLCVPLALRERELVETIERHAILQPTRLTCTKLDEASCTGALVSAYVRSGLPLCYFTTGQRVPEDLEVASAESMARWLCGSEVN